MYPVPTRPRERGSMLILALAVLVLLSLLAVAFAALMRLERRATENFKNVRRTDFIAGSAESNVIAMLRGGAFWSAFIHYQEGRSPWLYGVRATRPQVGGELPLEEAKPGDTSYSWHIGSTYSQGSDYFKTKVIDAASQIDLNGEQDTLAQMLDNLGRALDGDPNYHSQNPFYEEYPERGSKISGRDIVRFRNRLEGNRFSSKSQLREIIGAENFERVSDFVTTHAWVDPDTWRGSDGVEENRNFGDQPASGTTIGGADTGLVTPIIGKARLALEPRSPININTAAEPVLIACLMGLSCRRPFPYATIERQRTEAANQGVIDTDGVLPPTEEELTLRSEPVWVYSEPLSYDHAKAIAGQIVSTRKVRPFKVWKAGTKEAGGFEEFVNDLDESICFPDPSTIEVVLPETKGSGRSTRFAGDLLSTSSEVGKVFSRGHDSSEAAWRNAKGLGYSQRYAWYYDMMRGMLIANFNPNTRISKYNPNHTVFQPVDKSNLIRYDRTGEGDGTPRPGHTTEFCFDSNGIFEITVLAQMTGATSVAAAAASAEQDYEGAPRFAQLKRRTLVKVFETLRHTTQADFEEPFTSGSFTSVRNRKYTVTYPDPITALHPDLYYGSDEDGRVEIMGDVDAQRQNVEPNLRRDFPYQARAAFLLYEGFHFREPGSAGRLVSLGRKNRVGSDYAIELRRILDPDFVRTLGAFSKRYSEDYWKSGDSSDEVSAQLNEPLVETVSRGGEIYPDGLCTGLFHASAIGTRFLQYPASFVRVKPDDQGAMRAATNEAGNLPYYWGGVAFWVKLEFDAADPVFCGMVGATQVKTQVAEDISGSEGTRFFVWKNTSGELRVSRLYYHQAFLKGQTQQAVPFIGEEDDPEAAELEVDARKLHARTDVIVDISNWKAHEWHHVAVEYNDDIPGNRIGVQVDFEDVDAISHNLGEGKFCALNEEEPKDGIFIGGFYRDQATAEEGLFKFATNLDADRQLVQESHKRIPLNGTMDEFTTYTQSYNPPDGARGYFFDETAEYANLFRVAIPDGIQRLRLRSFSWTEYVPTHYAGRPVSWTSQNLQAGLVGVGQSTSVIPVPDAGGDAQENQATAGKWLYAEGTLAEERNIEVVYQFKMRAALGSDKYGARAVASPAIDDVTLTYYLPSAQILLSEEDD